MSIQLRNNLRHPVFYLFVASLAGAYSIFNYVNPHYTLEKRPISSEQQKQNDSADQADSEWELLNRKLAQAPALRDSALSAQRITQMNSGAIKAPPRLMAQKNDRL